MCPLAISDLEPDTCYWARRKRPADAAFEVVQISTVFGTGPDYLSVAVLGSDQHYSLQDYTFMQKISPQPMILASGWVSNESDASIQDLHAHGCERPADSVVDVGKSVLFGDGIGVP